MRKIKLSLLIDFELKYVEKHMNLQLLHSRPTETHTYVQSRSGRVRQRSITLSATCMFCGLDSSSTLASSRHVWSTIEA